MSDFPEKENNIPEIGEGDGFSTVFSDPTEHKKTTVKAKRKLLPKIIAAVLCVSLLVGGTVAVIKLIPEKDEENSSSAGLETIKVLDKKTDDFKTVTVTNKNGSFKLYSVKTPNTSSSSDTSSTTETVNWYLDGYDKEVISSSSVESIAGYAATLEATREITEKSAADCGLEKPVCKADVVTNSGEEYSILVGSLSPDNTGTYVKLSNSDKIYLTESMLEENFTFDALSLAATDAIAGVAVNDSMKSYTDDKGELISFDSITLTGTNYPEKIVLTPNNDKNLSQYAAFMTTSPTRRIADKVDGILGFFKSGVTVTGAYSFKTDAATLKSLGLDKPELTATIKVGNLTQAYSFKLQSDGSYAVWYDGAKLIKKVSADSIAFINYKVTDYYASWVCLQSINELSNFTIKTPEKTYSFDIVYDDKEDAEETYVITYNGKKLVASNFQNFYQECISLACTDYTVDNVKGDPAMSIIFTYSDTSRAKSTVEFRKATETKYQYRIDGIDMGKINSSSLNKILRYVEKVAAGEEIK